jgi:protein-tyrosine phosphatase
MTGWSASPEAVLIGAELGADLSGHRARGLEELELMEPEEVLTMEPHHTRAVLRRFPEWADRVHLLDPGGLAIADPYGLSTAHYRAARDQIVAALDIHARRWSA